MLYNVKRGFTLIESIGQVKPDASHKIAGELSGSRLTYPCYHGFTPCRHPETSPITFKGCPESCYSGSNKTVSGSSRFINGFTLIELLVVVLIIGILAAVALPQYNKAVAKARVTQWVALTDAFKKGAEAYILEHGYPTEGWWSFSEEAAEGGTTAHLDIELPTTSFDYFASADYNIPEPSYGIYSGAAYVANSIPGIDALSYEKYQNKNAWEGMCVPDNSQGMLMCKILRDQYGYTCSDFGEPCN